MVDRKIIQGLLGLAALTVTLYATWSWWPSEDDSSTAPSASEKSNEAMRLRLTAAKATAAGIRTEAVTRRTLTLITTVPGRFAYDHRHHVAVRVPADAVVDKLLVKPGEQVESGHILAIVRSPAIGTARSELLRRQADLQLLASKHQQMARVHDGVANLIRALQAGDPPDSLQRQLTEATLGEYRGRLLTNYSKLRLVTQLSEAASNSGGAISGRVVQERLAEQQQARAELDGAVEQASFQTDQAMQSAASEVDAARRSLSVAQQELAMLLGTHGEAGEAPTISANDAALTRLEIRSPICGTIERIGYSATERVSAGDELFIVADTSHLWVEADIRGHNWVAVDVATGQAVTVSTPADTEARFDAQVYYVGREVDPNTGAIPLVAEIANEHGKFRPGLFARVEVPIASLDGVIAVPPSAVVDLQGQTNVFVAVNEGFEPAQVQTGESNSQWIEIRQGLREGQEVVVEGAFMLKSELLLEGEE
jgi:RND family efflux transporter MFP subunit